MLSVALIVQQILRSRFITRMLRNHPSFKAKMADFKAKYGGPEHTLHLASGESSTVFETLFGFLLEDLETLDPKKDLDGEEDFGKAKVTKKLKIPPAKRQKQQESPSSDKGNSNGGSGSNSGNGSGSISTNSENVDHEQQKESGDNGSVSTSNADENQEAGSSGGVQVTGMDQQAERNAAEALCTL